MTDHTHIFRSFDTDLQELADALLAMGGCVEKHIEDASRAMAERDERLAQRVIADDRLVDQAELTIDDLCLRLLALRQPAASDLRFIASALKIVTDLERIGDLAVNMAERALELCREPPIKVEVDLPLMAGAARKMLRDALEAFVARDVERARAVLEADRQVDDWLRRVVSAVSAAMQASPAAVEGGIATLLFARHIERLADHTKNLAEMVVFLTRGQDVRHSGPWW